MQKRVIRLVLPVVLVAAFASCDDDKPTEPSNITYTATLRGTNENPSNNSAGTGTWTGILNPSTKVLTYTLSFQGLSGTSSQAHIHGPASTTQNIGVLVNFASPPAGHTGSLTLNGATGSATGTLNLGTSPISATVSGDSLLKLFDAGMAYVNVHSTPNFGGGEIRGQIARQ